MNWNYDTLYNLFVNDKKIGLLLEGKVGLEKESARTTLNGNLALTEHPKIFGDKFDNPFITTDFSESQIEIITPPHTSVEETYSFLKEKQQEVENGLINEILWPLSMPPQLPEDDKIPIAKFKPSKEGTEKELYRKGLAFRYGKKMQLISGLHYNFSFSDNLINFLYDKLGNDISKVHFKNKLYLSVTRNFLRFRWLLIYLYGASPTADNTYTSVIEKELEIIKKCCPTCYFELNDYEKFSTSLRVSRFGYFSGLQTKFNVSFNNLMEYIKDIKVLLSTKDPSYTEIGIYKDGNQIQLNDNVLQRESEFYSSIRFKQILKEDSTQLEALEKRGIEYLEIRILDLNPFEKLGISTEQLRFIQVFVIYCLLESNKTIDSKELESINRNHNLVSLFGRMEDLKLNTYDENIINLKDWATCIFEKLKEIAIIMDKCLNKNTYEKIVTNEYKKVLDTSLLPSSKIIKEMSDYNENFIDFGLRRAKENIMK